MPILIHIKIIDGEQFHESYQQEQCQYDLHIGQQQTSLCPHPCQLIRQNQDRIIGLCFSPLQQRHTQMESVLLNVEALSPSLFLFKRETIQEHRAIFSGYH